MEGLPLPTELSAAATTGSSGGTSGKMAGAGSSLSSKSTSSSSSGTIAGSDPLPGETEAQYVARQRKLQEEVCKLYLV